MKRQLESPLQEGEQCSCLNHIFFQIVAHVFSATDDDVSDNTWLRRKIDSYRMPLTNWISDDRFQVNQIYYLLHQ